MPELTHTLLERLAELKDKRQGRVSEYFNTLHVHCQNPQEKDILWKGAWTFDVDSSCEEEDDEVARYIVKFYREQEHLPSWFNPNLDVLHAMRWVESPEMSDKAREGAYIALHATILAVIEDG